jgi:hypothetical protein
MMQLHGHQDTTHEDLLQTWLQITRTLVSVGHAADLRIALWVSEMIEDEK